MKKSIRFKPVLFYLFLLFAIFGIGVIYIGYAILRTQLAPNPPGDHYQLRGAVSAYIPDALYYDFEAPQPEGVSIVAPGRYDSTSLMAAANGGHSPVINIPLGNYDLRKTKQFALSAWIRADSLEGPADACIIFIIANSLNDVRFSHILSIEGAEVPRGEWFKVSTAFETSTYQPSADDRIRIYLWNKGSGNFRLDDLTLIFGAKSIQGSGPSAVVKSDSGPAFPVNTPPYPPIYMQVAATGPDHASALVNEKGKCAGYFFSDEVLLAGNFLHPYGKAQDLLAISSGKLELVYYINSEKKFSGALIPVPALSKKFLSSARVYAAELNGDQYSEVIFCQPGNDSIFVMSLDRRNIKEPAVVLNGYKLPSPAAFKTFCIANVTGDPASELLCFESSGTWKLYGWQKNTCLEIAAGPTLFKGAEELSLTAVRNEKNGRDRIFAIAEDPINRSVRYSLFRYDEVKKSLLPDLKKNQGFGCMPGTDSLHTTDTYYAVDLIAGDGPELLRRRESWRYDLKLLSLNDSAYTVIGSIEYPPALLDENPKYYEYLRIVPGCFTEAGKWGLMLMCGSRSQAKKDKIVGVKTEFFIPAK
jgi:hypothetical protein